MNTRRFLPMAILVGTVGLTSALPSLAQTTGAGTDRTVTRVDNDRDWGWIGLLGLAGLLGLRRRPDRTDYTTTTPRPAR